MHSLVIETVTKRYGTTLALDEVSFVVDPGEFVALLGPSGAGKSTLFRCVTRLVAPDTGVVRVLGRDMSALGGQELRLARRDVGLIFQQFNLIGRLSAMDNVLAGRMGHASTLRVMLRQFTRADRQLALAALDRVDEVFLDTEADNMYHYKTRVCLFQLLVDREIFLVDVLAPGLNVEPLLKVLAKKHLVMHGVISISACCPISVVSGR